MAAGTKLLNKTGRFVVYCSSLRGISQQARTFSSGDKRSPSSTSYVKDAAEETNNTGTVWPDPNLGLLGPKDKRLPLPGNVGLANQFLSMKPTPTETPKQAESDVLTTVLPSERHSATISQAFSTDDVSYDIGEELLLPRATDILECVAQECPQLLKKAFSDLFIGRDLASSRLTVITFSQKTEHDMSAWDSEVEQEREELVLYFVMAASDICEKLEHEGYWADFIDPASGRPYLGPYTNSTFFETDERYRHLGFKIEDLGCCKVISHRVWGTHTFVGSIFTNAPANSPAVKTILQSPSQSRDKPKA